MVIKNGNGTRNPSRKGCRCMDAEIEVLTLALPPKLRANIPAAFTIEGGS